MNRHIQRLKMDALEYATKLCDGKPIGPNGEVKTEVFITRYTQLVVDKCISVMTGSAPDFITSTVMKEGAPLIREYFEVPNERPIIE